jgi:pyruvate dehydrogenase E2 component (dihydrolipoamide acetyltransferase)
VPSPSVGVIKSVAVKKGDRVSKGSLIVEVEGGASETPKPTKASAQPAAAASKPAAPAKAEVREAPAPPQQAAVRQSQVTVPDIGDFKDVEVIEVLVKPGDSINVDTPLITLETEKATMDVPAPEAGKVKSVAVKKGDRVSKGSVIVEIEGAGTQEPQRAATPPAAAQGQEEKQRSAPPRESAPAATAPQGQAARSSPVVVAIDEAGFARAYASPSVRKFAREVGVDLVRVKGSGVKGRITPEDVKAWIKQALTSGGAAGATGGAGLPKVPEVDFAKFGAIETKPLGRIQKISGARLQASWLNIPHVWQMDEADITELEEARNKLKGKAAAEGIKLTPLAFILRACVKALQEFPNVNSSLDPSGQSLVLKKYIHLGFAADTPNGLVVPVIRDADRKDIYELARDLAALSAKARDGKLSAAECRVRALRCRVSAESAARALLRSSTRLRLRSSVSPNHRCSRSIRMGSSCLD